MNDSLLMTFVKNPILGTAKTRLAASVGDEKALEIYKFLLQYTAYISSGVTVDRQILYSTKVEENDMFDNNKFEKTVQIQGGLGKKMEAAFSDAFANGYKKVVIIGSDCYQLNEAILNEAFYTLDKNDFVLGPAYDGGYYLMGMRKKETAVFQNKKWSSERVYTDTLIDLEVLRYSYHELPKLSDIDYLEDLPEELRLRFGV